MQENKMNTIGPDLESKIMYIKNFKDPENEKNISNLSTGYCGSSAKYFHDKTSNSTNAKETCISSESQLLTLNPSQIKISSNHLTLNFPQKISSAENLPCASQIDYEDEKYNKFPFRKDRHGVPIVKGGKRHKVTFADAKSVGNTLVERIKVESYKSNNVENSYSEDKPNRSTENCCMVF